MENNLTNYGQNLIVKDKQSKLANIILGLLVGLLALFFVFNLTVSVCQVDGNSMADTLANNQTVLLEKNPSGLRRGQIVTISGLSQRLIIKRIIAIEGDRLVFRHNSQSQSVELFRDIGQGYSLLDESSYIKSPMSLLGWEDDRRIFLDEYKLAPSDTQVEDFYKYEIQIGEGECFVLGDNRNDSSDSRKYGAGKLSNIKGRMFYEVRNGSILEKILLFIYREK